MEFWAVASIATPLIGFLAYTHPKESRPLLFQAILFCALLALLEMYVATTEKYAYTRALSVMVRKPEKQWSPINFDSLAKSSTPDVYDSIRQLTLGSLGRRILTGEEQDQILEGLRDKVAKLATKPDDEMVEARGFAVKSAIILLIMYALTYQFEKMLDSKNKKPTKSVEDVKPENGD